jgi:nitrate reductase assembly molybdenum cofactor insertion protein NarJ
MDSLHEVLRSIRPETKAAPDHLTVFREFLAHLDELQRQAPQPRAPMRRKTLQRKV